MFGKLALVGSAVVIGTVLSGCNEPGKTNNFVGTWKTSGATVVSVAIDNAIVTTVAADGETHAFALKVIDDNDAVFGPDGYLIKLRLNSDGSLWLGPAGTDPPETLMRS